MKCSQRECTKKQPTQIRGESRQNQETSLLEMTKNSYKQRSKPEG